MESVIPAHDMSTVQAALLHFGGTRSGEFFRPRIAELYHRLRATPGSREGYEVEFVHGDRALIDSALLSYGENEFRRPNVLAVLNRARKNWS